NPLHPNSIWAPEGVNMAWVTGVPGPALATWPITHLFGPIVSSNSVAVLSPALGGWAAYLLCRRAAPAFWPAVAGGYLFGFSTYEVAQMHGHLNLFLVFPVPLAAYLVVRYVDGSLPGGRFVAGLSAVLILEFSISTEVFASMAFFGALALFGCWWRLRDRRHVISRAIVLVGTAYAVTGLIVSPYLVAAVTGIPNGPLRPVAK